MTRKSDFFLGGLGMGASTHALRRNTRNVGAHWDLEVGDNGPRLSDRDGDGGGARLGPGGERSNKSGGGRDRGEDKSAGGANVMMRDLGFGGTDVSHKAVDDGVVLTDIRRPKRASMRYQAASRESMKEQLLR